MSRFSMTYDPELTWEENCDRGPAFDDLPMAVPETSWKTFFGLPVRSRIGIAAGLLPNSRWVLPYSLRGWDILTYKTVRSQYRPSYPKPNWVFVEEDSSAPDSPVWVRQRKPDSVEAATSSVCFGMPSMSPELWRQDIRQTRVGLGLGQVLIVSVVATPGKESSLDSVADDFAQCAAWAVEAGADIIEVNLSCPNVCTSEGTLYHDARSSHVVVERVRKAIGGVRLLLKIGTFESREKMSFFLRTLNPVADGVVLVNCLTREVCYRDGRPAFGEQFRRAGVLGRAIHGPSVSLVRMAVEIIDEDQLGLKVVGVGGAFRESDFEDFFSAGAEAVLCGSSPALLPNLAAEMKRKHPDW